MDSLNPNHPEPNGRSDADSHTPHPAQPPGPEPHEEQRLPTFARWSVAAALSGQDYQPPVPSEGFLAQPHGVFVTIRNQAGDLRGCVGSLSPRCQTLLEETWRVAREAAFGDLRFKSVTRPELPELVFEVSVLEPLEPVQSTADLDPAVYGVVVETDDRRRGALLPGIPGVETVEQQLSIARRKAHIAAHEPVRLQRFRITAFHENP